MSSIQSTQSSSSFSSLPGSQGTSSKAELRAKMEAKLQASGLTRAEFRAEMMQSGEAAKTMQALQSTASDTPDSGTQSREQSSQVQSGSVASDTLVKQFGLGSEIDTQA
ncbi:MAG: hypothetical protein JKX70_04385 [Phycisphaerales bacterium]|nr:hypothetical protein [Phycisphaerales bacterium]